MVVSCPTVGWNLFFSAEKSLLFSKDALPIQVFYFYQATTIV